MSLATIDRSTGEALLALLLLACVAAFSNADEIDEDSLIDADIDVEAIALRAEGTLRADRRFMQARVSVRSARGAIQRAIEFECWNDRIERRSFIRVLAPESDAGVALLDLPPNLWRYQPEMGRTQRVPRSDFSEPWMKSDFVIGDLIDPFGEPEDDEVELLRVEGASAAATGARSYVVQYTPRPTASAARGRRIAWIGVEDGLTLREEFFDARGERLRTLQFSDFRSVAGRHFPYRWTAIGPGKTGRESILEIRELRFEADFDDAVFAIKNLSPAPTANSNPDPNG